MASKWILVQTEKAFDLQKNSVFTLAHFDKNFKTNKIEITKLLKTQGIDVESVTSTASHQKTKLRGKGRVKVKQYRPKKWYVKLKTGQTISEDLIKELNK